MLAVGAGVFVFTELVFVVVFRIRDDKNPPSQPVDSPREEGSLRTSLVMYFTMLLDLGESVSKRVMCGYSGAHL